MSVKTAIVEFSREQPAWVQDAFRRVATQREISDKDIEELGTLLRAENGLGADDQTNSSMPLDESHFTDTSTDGGVVHLLELRDVKGANRLAEGQTLRFAKSGITLIYGDNGSGKSGYCRLLKNLCRIREGAQSKILPDAFEQQPADPAEVVVRFSDQSGVEQTTRWVDGSPPPSDLRQISVFDSQAAPLYVDKEGKVESLPYGLDLLPRLGVLFGKLARELESELLGVRANCQTTLPSLPDNSAPWQLVAKLTLTQPLEHLPSETEIEDLAEFNEKHSDRLGELEQILSDSGSELITSLGNASQTARIASNKITEVLPHVDDKSLEQLRRQVLEAEEARAAAELAASSLFEDEPLPDVGSGPWRRMYRYAREYSSIAYPEASFPWVGDESRCVLCQQELTPEARSRLERFEAFVRGTAETEAEKAENAIAGELETLQSLDLGDPGTSTAPLLGFDGADQALKTGAESFLTNLRDRRSAAIEFLGGSRKSLDPDPLDADPTKRLAKAADFFDALAAKIETAMVDPDERNKLQKELEDLQARKLFSQNRRAFEERRALLEEAHKLKLCIDSCNTAALSRKNTELRRKFITGEFAKRLDHEVSRLQIDYLPIKVKDHTDRGESFVGVDLEMHRSARLSDVLSEGEQKALALAAFFAEVDGIPGDGGLVFDDPVSSLDHARRRQVAERLVEAAQDGRQIVIFTHDLFFFSEVQSAAAAASPQAEVITHEVKKSEEYGFGTVNEDEQPWFAADVRRRMPVLEKRLSELRSISDQGTDEYRRAVISFYTDLRETWEQLVEADLLGGVVTRFTKDVKTQSLKTVVVDDDDYCKVYFGMKRASEWSGHSPPPAGNIKPPDYKTAASDLQALSEFRKHLKDRKKVLEPKRKALESAPKATLS